ncbi:MAG: hypothetical protein GC168_05175 [Candidatus Hydrogenedens sp.]|nr:hypothetical protein [Candidatus Hydrogenedens sp.]
MIILDENLPIHASRMLDAFDQRYECRSILDYAPRGTGDIEIFELLGGFDEKPVFVSQDMKILKRPAERAALKGVDISVVFLASAWSSYSWPDKAWRLVKIWPSVTNEVTRVLKPTLFELHAGKALKINRLRLTAEL